MTLASDVRHGTSHRRGIVITVVVSVVVVGLLAAVAIGFLASVSRDQRSEVTVQDDRIAFEFEVPGQAAISRIHASDAADGCAMVAYWLNDYGLMVESVSKTCRIPREQRIHNGDHGTYRTLADVPDPLDIEKTMTDLGAAVVFTQIYAEYTNVRSKWEEPVAIVTLENPVDPGYPTLVLRSVGDGLDRDEFMEVLRSLEDPR